MVTSPIGLCRSCRLAMPAHAAATAGFSTQEGEIPLETDCLLEGSGFELPVPRCALIANSAALVAPPDSAVRGGSLNGRLDVARYTATVLKDSEPSLTWVLGLRPEVFERAGAAQISGPSLPRRRDLQYP